LVSCRQSGDRAAEVIHLPGGLPAIPGRVGHDAKQVQSEFTGSGVAFFNAVRAVLYAEKGKFPWVTTGNDPGMADHHV
jgi:hypothetical protein